MSRSLFNESVRVTVVVPTFNRCSDLARCLNSLIRQTFANFEILVIDNGSTDDTPKLLLKYPVRVIQDLTRNLTHVFNTGWRSSSGQIVAWINDDAEACPSWIESIIHEFDKHPEASAIGGPTLAMRKQAINELHEISRRLRNLGGFDENFLFNHADGDLFVRMRKSGHMLLFSPNVVVFHHVNPTGAVRNAHNLGRDQAYFYMKDISHTKIQNAFRVLLNALYFNAYWVYEAVRKGNPRALNGVLGFALGVIAYYRKNQGR